MIDQKPRDPLYPQGFEDIDNLKNRQIPRPKPKENEDNDLKILKSFNQKLGKYIGPKPKNIIENEEKKKIGMIITTLIILTLVISTYYFLIYEPSQEELNLAKTTKLNELHSLYTGALTSSSEAMILENEINNARSKNEVESINILSPATKAWKSFHKKSINANLDPYNRTMATYTDNNTKNAIMPASEALTIVDENNAEVLSKIKFEKPNTVSVPILVSRLQAGAGLVNVGSVVDIYTSSNYTENGTPNNQTNPDIKGCTVVSIMRCEENGEIDSEYSKANTVVHGNNTNPNENTQTFKSNVLELLKGSIINGYNEKQTAELLQNYGIKLSNYERQINLGDLDAQYMLLVETPQDKVNFLLDNMDQIILTIPTTNAPLWMAVSYTHLRAHETAANMDKPKITTIVVIICIIILGLYAAGEVNYYSSKIAIEKNIDSPVVNIPTIGIEEKINNVSLSQGVMHDAKSFTPTNGDVILSGHRTLQGSPFLRLNELNNGDVITLEWPGIGEVNYTVINKTIVEPTARINTQSNGTHIYLITCDPIGSTAHRLIIEGELSDVGPINDKIIQNNPHESYALIITTAFLVIGLIFSYFYPKDNRIYILAIVLIISAILFYFYLFPIDSNIIYEKILWLNGGM